MEKLTRKELETIEAVLWRQVLRFRHGEYLDDDERRLRQIEVETAHRKVQRLQLESE